MKRRCLMREGRSVRKKHRLLFLQMVTHSSVVLLCRNNLSTLNRPPTPSPSLLSPSLQQTLKESLPSTLSASSSNPNPLNSVTNKQSTSISPGITLSLTKSSPTTLSLNLPILLRLLMGNFSLILLRKVRGMLM